MDTTKLVTTNKQLDSLLHRPRRNPTMEAMHLETIDTDSQKLDEVEDTQDNATKMVLPHHPFTNVNKPGNVHRVLGGDQHLQSLFLNNTFLTGTEFLTKLTGIIIRNREDGIAISEDIEELFLQVFVKLQNQPYLRKLWKDDNHKHITYQYTCQTFGSMNSTCYATRQCAKDKTDKLPSLVKTTETIIFIDDFYKAISTPAEATILIKDLQTLLSEEVST